MSTLYLTHYISEVAACTIIDQHLYTAAANRAALPRWAGHAQTMLVCKIKRPRSNTTAQNKRQPSGRTRNSSFSWFRGSSLCADKETEGRDVSAFWASPPPCFMVRNGQQSCRRNGLCFLYATFFPCSSICLLSLISRVCSSLVCFSNAIF